MIRRILARIMVRMLMWDGEYLQRKLLLKYAVYGPKGRLKLSPTCNVQNTLFNTNSGNITVGAHSFFGHNCMVLTGTHDASLRGAERLSIHPTEGRDIEIGEGVWVSSGATILGKLRIADNVVIAAGAVVTKDCLAPGVYAGVPAKLIGSVPERN